MMTTIPNFALTQSLDANWVQISELTSTLMSSSGDSSLAALNTRDELSQYSQLFNDLRHDRLVPGKDKNGNAIEITLLGMRRAPGSKNRHHNVEGGLVKHLLQMWEIWTGLRGILRDHDAQHAQLNDLNIWKCILHHDLNKVWKYKLVMPTPEWEVDYANEQDRLTTLLGDTNKVMFLLNKHGIKLPIPLHNALLTAEGGYSKTQPYAETVLAKTAYLLDELSANVVDRLQTNRFWDSKQGGISELP